MVQNGIQRPLPHQKNHITSNKKKVMFIAFLDHESVVHHEIVPALQTVRGSFKKTEGQLKENVPLSGKEDGHCILHQENVFSHTLIVVQIFFTERNIPLLH